tara:strand:+ start:3221 stop:3724 length:504 start_codon:yes stop_codon:yes gene_type:complete
MGTRGAIGYFGKLDGENLHKVTYNHYDSYPSCLGKQVVGYIKNKDFDNIKEDFEKIKLIEDGGNNYHDMRDLQGDLDGYSKVGKMIDNQLFLHDSLFCEWAYIINMNTKKLEIYRGFTEGTPKGRYRNVEKDKNGYGGVSLLKSIPLEDVTEEMMDKIENEVYECNS